MVLYGARGHAKVIYDLILSNDLLLEYLVDDNPPENFSHHLEIYKPSIKLLKNKKIIIAVGDNKIRAQIAMRYQNICDYEILIHRSAYVSRFSEISEGSVIMPQVCINAGSKIGKHCIINSAAVIEHECYIEDFVHVSPGVLMAGNINIGSGAHIGLGARIIPGINIGRNAVVGAGAVVTKDIPDNAVVVGIPAKPIKYNSDE